MPFKAKPKVKCAVPDCLRWRYAASRDLCGPHLGRWKRTGDVQADIPIGESQGGRNKAPDPVKPSWAVGWCHPCHRWVSNLIHVPSNPVGVV